MALQLGQKNYPLYIDKDILFLEKSIRMPVHSMVTLPGKLNKKELTKRHITITRVNGEVQLFVDGFKAQGTIKNNEIPTILFSKENFLFEAINYYNTAKNPNEIRALFRNKFKSNKSGSLLNIPQLWEKFINSKVNFSF